MEEDLFIKGHEGACVRLIEEFKCKVEIVLGMVLEVQDMVPLIRI